MVGAVLSVAEVEEVDVDASDGFAIGKGPPGILDSDIVSQTFWSTVL